MWKDQDGGTIAAGGAPEHKRSDLLGVPVLDGPEGRTIGVVAELVLDLNGRQVAGVILTRGAREALAVPYGHLSVSSGPEVGLVAAYDSPGALVSQMFGADQLRGGHAVVGTEALTADGRLVGVIDDLVIEPESGAIIAVEVGQGPRTPPCRFHIDAVLRFGREYTLITEDAARCVPSSESTAEESRA